MKKRGLLRKDVGMVILTPSGRVFASVNASKPFRPASNQKILTVFGALESLGADYEYETTLWADRMPVDGELTGDLCVTGSGDPNISGRFDVPGHGKRDPTAIFRQWASALKSKGVQRVRGDLLVDDFSFDHEFFNPTWKTDQFQYWYSAQVGALNLNDNCLDVRFQPGSLGGPGRLKIAPNTAYVRIDNKTKTDWNKKSVLIDLRRVEDSNQIVVRGGVSLRLKRWSTAFYVTIDDPGLFFGTVLKEVFQEEGIVVDGRVLRDRARLSVPSTRVELVRHLSPLERDLPVILSNSQNMHAEALLKALGAASGEVGSVASGAREIFERLYENGVPDEGLAVADGSGYSRGNFVSPNTLAQLLHRIVEKDYFEVFRRSLAVAGQSGTLRKRFRGSKLSGELFAKTGTISGVSSLSGYIRVPRRGDAQGKGSRPVKVAGAEESSKPRRALLQGADELLSDRYWTFVILVNSQRGNPRAFQADVAREILRGM